MGWNEGYIVMEQTVISAYNAGNLTAETLRAILEPYRGTDIDHGGCMNLVTHDGKSADDVIISILCPAEYLNLCAVKTALENEGITGESIYGLGEIPNGAKRHKLYGGAEVIRDRRSVHGFRVESTPELKLGQERMGYYEDHYQRVLDAVTGCG